jgi:hypothetical protein
LPLPEQNWNAAFGAIYLANINWEVFTFGGFVDVFMLRMRHWTSPNAILTQEEFQHQIRIAAAYLNVLGTHGWLPLSKKILSVRR